MPMDARDIETMIKDEDGAAFIIHSGADDYHRSSCDGTSK